MHRIRLQPFFLLTLFILLFQTSGGICGPVLTRLSRADEQEHLRLFLYFTELPAYSIEKLGKRIDLILQSTTTGDAFQLPGTDDRLIKAITSTKGNDTLLSLYFRYEPQHSEIIRQDDGLSLVLDVLPGNAFSIAYPELSSGLHGITMVDRAAVDYTNPVHLSSWAGNWPIFFKEYESPVQIMPRPRLTLPPFPLAGIMDGDSSSWLPQEIRTLADKKNWPQALSEIRLLAVKESDPLIRQKILLTLGELLVRSNEFEEPYRQLQEISLSYPNTQTALLARYLFLYLQAAREDAYLALAEIEKLAPDIPPGSALGPYATLLQAELAMLTGQLEKAEKLLFRDDLAFTGPALTLRLLRQADLRYLQKKTINALVSYLQLIDPQGNSAGSDPAIEVKEDALANTVLADQPSSLAYFSDSLYNNNRRGLAEQGYKQLSYLLSGEKMQGLAMYRHAMSRLHNGATFDRVAPELFQVEDTFPGSEGAARALMKTTDYGFLGKKIPWQTVAQQYHDLANDSDNRLVREEAAFKEALVYSLNGDDATSVQLLMQLLRDYQNGALKIESRALLLERLPGLLADLIQKEQFVEALVLAKQNRFFFTRGWLDTRILHDIAEAYTKLGIYDRAAQTYQYILENSSVESQESVYLPLLQVLFAAEQYNLVEDFADQYAFRFPEGANRPQIFAIRLDALIRIGDLPRAGRLLDNAQIPLDQKTTEAAASVYFGLEQYDKVIAFFDEGKLQSATANPDLVFLLAESLFAKELFDRAAPLFNTLTATERYKDQAMFRGAYILKKNGKIDDALKQLQLLAEKGTDPLWVKLANEEVALLTLEQKK